MNNIDSEFDKLEKKIGAKTIGEEKCATIECKRKWFRSEFDYVSDDESVCEAWEKRDD